MAEIKLKQKDYEAIIKNMDIELSIAKGIIREFVEWANWQGNSECPRFKNIQDKAEAFVKENEK